MLNVITFSAQKSKSPNSCSSVDDLLAISYTGSKCSNQMIPIEGLEIVTTSTPTAVPSATPTANPTIAHIIVGKEVTYISGVTIPACGGAEDYWTVELPIESEMAGFTPSSDADHDPTSKWDMTTSKFIKFEVDLVVTGLATSPFGDPPPFENR